MTHKTIPKLKGQELHNSVNILECYKVDINKTAKIKDGVNLGKGAFINYVTRQVGGGGRRSVTLCDKGERDPKFCDITFQKQYLGDITRINQIETIPLKRIAH